MSLDRPSGDLLLRRKWTLHAHGQQVVFIKKVNERAAHVLMKAFLWALYLPTYPDLRVEVSIGDRYKPDVVSLDEMDPFAEPRFWGEAGQVSVDKIRSLARRYPHTHFAMSKWQTSLDPYIDIVQEALSDLKRTASYDLITFPSDSAVRFINDRGEIKLTFDDLDWVRLGDEPTDRKQ